MLMIILCWVCYVLAVGSYGVVCWLLSNMLSAELWLGQSFEKIDIKLHFMLTHCVCVGWGGGGGGERRVFSHIHHRQQQIERTTRGSNGTTTCERFWRKPVCMPPGPMAVCSSRCTKRQARCWPSSRCLWTLTCRRSSKKSLSCSSVTASTSSSTTVATSRTQTCG